MVSDIEDLNAAVQLLEAALKMAPAGATPLQIMRDLSLALENRYHDHGDPKDTDRASALRKQLLEGAPSR